MANASNALKMSPMAPNQDPQLGKNYTITSSYENYIPGITGLNFIVYLIGVKFTINGPSFGGILLYVSEKNSSSTVGIFDIQSPFQNNDIVCKTDNKNSSLTHTIGSV